MSFDHGPSNLAGESRSKIAFREPDNSSMLAGRSLLPNSGIPLDLNWLQEVRVNTSAVERRAQTQVARRTVKKEWQAAWLLRALSCMDLTTLSGDDTEERVRRLCAKARQPIQQDLVHKLGIEELGVKVAAVCVYHTFIETALSALEGSGVHVAAVSTGFPAGLSPLAERVAEIRRSVEAGAHEIDVVITRAHVFGGRWQALYDEVATFKQACGAAHMKVILGTGDLLTLRNVGRASLVAMMAGADFISGVHVAAVSTGFPAGLSPLAERVAEIRRSVEAGAHEIDVVITRAHVFGGRWQALYDEVATFKQACGGAHMKVILGTGDLLTLRNVARASLVAMMAGADFIKTSTGKEPTNATLPVSLVMVRAIREYAQQTGMAVGFKPAGGIRTAKQSIDWLAMMKEELGPSWMRAELFRFGASGLLGDIERQLEHYATGRYSAEYRHPIA